MTLVRHRLFLRLDVDDVVHFTSTQKGPTHRDDGTVRGARWVLLDDDFESTSRLRIVRCRCLSFVDVLLRYATTTQLSRELV